jgi:DNA topoisomerase-3
MREIAAMTEHIVKKAKEFDRDTIPGDYATLQTPCPKCGGVVKENYRRYGCVGKDGASEGCGFSISKIPGGRTFEAAEVEQFIRDKKIGPLDGFRSKTRTGSSNSTLVTTRTPSLARSWSLVTARPWATAPSAAAPSMNTAATMCAARPYPRMHKPHRAATSRAARSSCSNPWHVSK